VLDPVATALGSVISYDRKILRHRSNCSDDDK
jgi:hypothetical protein